MNSTVTQLKQISNDDHALNDALSEALFDSPYTIEQVAQKLDMSESKLHRLIRAEQNYTAEARAAANAWLHAEGNAFRADGDALRAEIESLQTRHNLSQAATAKEANLSAAALSTWVARKYKGDRAKVAQMMRRWIAMRQNKAVTESKLPQVPQFVMTPTGQRIIAALSYAQVAQDLVVIYGGAGAGKTSAIAHHARSAPNVWVIEVTPATCSVGASLRALCHALGLPITTGHTDALESKIRARVANTGGLLIVDEAQFLQVRSLESYRRIAELCNIGLALVGNETIYGQLTGRTRAAEFAQLFSRIGKRVELRKPAEEDVKAIADAWQIDGSEELALLQRIASRPGALRMVAKTLKLATLMASGTDRTRLDVTLINAAYKDLGGAA